MSTRDELFKQIALEAIALEPAMIAMRREFHRHPEVGWLEYVTASRVCEELNNLGYVVRTGHDVVNGKYRLGVPDSLVLESAYELSLSAGAVQPWVGLMRNGFTGVIADLDTGRPGPSIAFRFDLDALPIKESIEDGHRPTAEGWASDSLNAMHACGHDGHLSMGLTFARLAMQLKPELSGRVRLIFQPAEEGVRGAVSMSTACAGIDKLFCLHLGLGVPTGEIIGGAVKFLATKEIHAHIVGRAAHAAIEPESGRSALLAAAQATLALHSLPQHGKYLVRVNVGILHGGVATNIVPPEADLYFRIRSDNHTAINELETRARQAVISSAQTYGCTAELEVTGQSGSEDSNSELAALVAELGRGIQGIVTIKQHQAFGGSEDATMLMSEIHRQGGQATYTMLGSDVVAGHHNDRFDFDERTLRIGVELLGRELVYFLCEPTNQEI